MDQLEPSRCFMPRHKKVASLSIQGNSTQVVEVTTRLAPPGRGASPGALRTLTGNGELDTAGVLKVGQWAGGAMGTRR
jgi:hypothetical protein